MCLFRHFATVRTYYSRTDLFSGISVWVLASYHPKDLFEMLGFCFRNGGMLSDLITQVVCKPMVCYILIFSLFCSCVLEWLCTILAACLAMPVGSALFIMMFYHPLHDILGIHTEVPVFMWFGLLCVIVWASDRNPNPEARTGFNMGKDLLCLFIK